MSVRLCKECAELAKRAGNIEAVVRLIDKGQFFCVHGKPDCGKRNP